jgi:hypothetical protein
MGTEEERCAGVQKFQRVDEAFRAGDLDALRAAVEDPALIPNGPMPVPVGSCLVYAIYHSPLAFIRTLLEIGAAPNTPVDDGFPPLIAALSCAQEVPGSRRRPDVADILRLLLTFRADPNQRGINDYTPLHMAVAARSPLAVQILLDGGADPGLRTRIDACETPLEMAQSAGLADIAAILARTGRREPRRLRAGLTLLIDVPGTGEPVRRQHTYRVRLRLWLHHGEPVRWQAAWGTARGATLEDDGGTLTTDVRIHRGSLVSGLFYGVDGMRVGGMRKLEIAPHLAYGDQGVPGVIPPRAMLTAEITVLEACAAAQPWT